MPASEVAHRRRRRAVGTGPGMFLAVVVASVSLLSACGGDDKVAPKGEATPTTAPAPDFSDADLWLSFEDEAVSFDGGREFPDELERPYAGVVVTANDGKVKVVPGADGSGQGLKFPDPCTDEAGCPRAMVEVLSDAALDPGDADFEFGATVQMEPQETNKGSNILQKGRFGTAGGQWKLQVDNIAGNPSCVVRSDQEPVLVRSSETIADSAWHHVVCRRDAEGLSIDVDGTVDREDEQTGSIISEFPLRVGSPGVGDDDDQFHGRLDNVFLRVG